MFLHKINGKNIMENAFAGPTEKGYNKGKINYFNFPSNLIEFPFVLLNN